MISVPDDLSELCAASDAQTCTELVLDPVGVLSDPGRWPDHVCSDLSSVLRLEWAGVHAHLVAGTNKIGMRGDYVGERWISSGDRQPIAIGCRSIPASFPIRHLSSDVREDAKRFAVFPDDEYLLFPLITTNRFTTIEMYFLAKVREIDPSIHEWVAHGVKFRVLREYGSSMDEGSKAVIKNARAWWRGFGGKVVVRAGSGGPKHIPITYALVARYYRKLSAGFVGERRPSLADIAEAITDEQGITVSERTISRRLNGEWSQKKWPPR